MKKKNPIFHLVLFLFDRSYGTHGTMRRQQGGIPLSCVEEIEMQRYNQNLILLLLKLYYQILIKQI